MCVAKRSNQEINFTFEQDLKGKLSHHKKGMHVVRCLCGFKILVIPDLKAMNQAIKNHLTEHKKAGDVLGRINSLEGFLTEQVLMEAGKMNPSTVN
jgi:hypothetical protein